MTGLAKSRDSCWTTKVASCDLQHEPDKILPHQRPVQFVERESSSQAQKTIWNDADSGLGHIDVVTEQ
jgi:hypothetical protein